MPSRTGSPFHGSQPMAEAFTAVSYMRMNMGLRFDVSSGDITCSEQPHMDEPTVTGSPGEVLTKESVQSALLVGRSELSPLERLLNIAYMLGKLEGLSDEAGL